MCYIFENDMAQGYQIWCYWLNLWWCTLKHRSCWSADPADAPIAYLKSGNSQDFVFVGLMKRLPHNCVGRLGDPHWGLLNLRKRCKVQENPPSKKNNSVKRGVWKMKIEKKINQLGCAFRFRRCDIHGAIAIFDGLVEYRYMFNNQATLVRARWFF